ncbi:Uu.00g091380.m01.CDS01 [Anthostomella pinea]|uniref:Uu.00g091380.m01.CDS01 n=1 Tax=Anthostomella pinea TaxID=933095 RepID=A0AAI8YKE0_9PEZI|nr:Uu.00g091380.m01.CDS01 [Anthostomella pinea]
MEPDLSASITMHPHPFLHRTDSPARSPARSSTPRSPTHHTTHHTTSQAAIATRSLDGPSSPRESGNATSTGVEALDDEARGERPVSRYPSAAATDVESQTGNRRYSANDPYNLTSAFKTPAQLDEIKANTSRKRDNVAQGPTPVAGIKSRFRAKKIHTFYQSQNETIERLLKTVEEHRDDARQEAGEDHLRHQIAVYGSFCANVLLSVLQLYGAISSGSLSLFTTCADSVFDPLSNLTLILTYRAVKKVDPSRFPSGKARLENVGNITFCFLMIAVSLILIAFSCQDIANRFGTGAVVKDFHLPAVIAVSVAFCTKLALFFYCWGLKDKYSQIDILWQDHRNDLFINGFGVLTSVGGAKLAWWLDPMGAIILSVLITCIWLRTAFKEFLLLVGVVASVEIQQLITYVCVTHSPAIQGIDTVRVYHSGPRLIAEIDVVMDPNASLRDTHDVAEELQFKLEDLPDVERAYVHVDYETTHKPEHAIKKEL